MQAQMQTQMQMMQMMMMTVANGGHMRAGCMTPQVMPSASTGNSSHAEGSSDASDSFANCSSSSGTLNFDENAE